MQQTNTSPSIDPFFSQTAEILQRDMQKQLGADSPEWYEWTKDQISYYNEVIPAAEKPHYRNVVHFLREERIRLERLFGNGDGAAEDSRTREFAA